MRWKVRSANELLFCSGGLWPSHFFWNKCHHQSHYSEVDQSPAEFFPAQSNRTNFLIGFASNSSKLGKNFNRFRSPTRKDQLWRFSNVDLLDLSPFTFSGAMSDDDRRNVLNYSRGFDEVAGRMIFAGDQLIERDVVSEQLKKRGVIFQPLERAMVEHRRSFP